MVKIVELFVLKCFVSSTTQTVIQLTVRDNKETRTLNFFLKKDSKQ